MKHTQSGVSLITVLVLLLLTLVVVMGTFRAVMLHEILQGNSSDYQRSFAAAEALLRDAEVDIRGRLPPYTEIQPDGAAGRPCREVGTDAQDIVGCRERTAGSAWFPRNHAEFDEVRDTVHATSEKNLPCLNGICFPDNSTQLAHIGQQSTALRPLGACYGQYTQQAPRGSGMESNPVLRATFDSDKRCTQARAWYWIEAFRYTDGVPGSTAISEALRPDTSRGVVYRITALAEGMKTGTRVVLQSLFVPYPAHQNQ